jgi:hypothetical protein
LNRGKRWLVHFSGGQAFLTITDDGLAASPAAVLSVDSAGSYNGRYIDAAAMSALE